MILYEHRGQPPLSRRHFMRRMLRHAAFGAALMLGSLAIGVIGYHMLADQSWTDSYLNASMILGGMGPVAELHTTASKLFAGTYALYSGVVFLVLTAALLAPVLHRVIHRFHWDADQARAQAGDNA